MTGQPRRLSVTDQGDRELLARVHAGDAVAREVLLDRHRATVAAVGDADATADAALAADDRWPFRATWLALTATGALPPADTLLDDLPPPWRAPVWHHLVEGETPARVARVTGTSPDRVAEQLREVYAGRETSAYRRELAVRVLGPHAAAYLASRPEPPPLHRRPVRDPARVGVAVMVVAALVAALYVVPMGGRWIQGRLTATVEVPGTYLVPVAAVEGPPGPPTTPRAADAATAPGPAPAAGATPTAPVVPPPPAPQDPAPDPQPAPTPPPDVDPGPEPGTTVPLPGDLGEARVRPDRVEVEVRPPGKDPVVAEIPLSVPEVDGLG